VGGAGSDWVRGGLNTFDYVDDSPVDHVDRSGLLSVFDLKYGVQGASREQVREAFVDAAPGVALVGAVGGVAAIAVVAAPPPVKAAVVGAITRAFWGAQTAAFQVALVEAGAGAAVGVRCAGTAGGGGARTFEIVDGVRRAKAAELAGQTSIRANVEVGGRVVETLDVPLSSLRSPFKSAIDITSNPGTMGRFQNILNGTRAGDPLPPITVQPGTRGPSIFDIFFE
jgi:hypothetical protein